MTPSTFAVAMLLVACLAAVQARAARGTPRHRLEETCQMRGRAGLADEISAGIEPVAFIAATIVTVTATAATLLAGLSPDLLVAPGRLRVPGTLLWMGLVWALLVALPMLLARAAGAWILTSTWPVWRPLVAIVRPFVAGTARLGGLLARLLGRRGPVDDEPTVEEEVRAVVDEALREGRLEGAARDMIEGVMELRDARVARIMTPR
ncbi:MAG: CNNM domain-containing protein, partial [Planctomycetaceae bacterium]